VRSRTGLIALVTSVLAAAVACGPATAGRTGPSTARPDNQHHVSCWGCMRCSRCGRCAARSPRRRRSFSGQPACRFRRTPRHWAGWSGRPPAAPKPTAPPKLWQRHLVDLLAYAKAVAGHDTSATKTARAALLADANAYGSWLAQASHGQVQARAAARRSSIGRERRPSQAASGPRCSEGQLVLQP
jgi:hypothetical protein